MNAPDVTLLETTSSADVLILVPVTDTVLMPGMIMPLAIGRPAAATAIQEAARTDKHLAVVLQREPFADAPDLNDLHAIGTEARCCATSPAAMGRTMRSFRVSAEFVSKPWCTINLIPR